MLTQVLPQKHGYLHIRERHLAQLLAQLLPGLGQHRVRAGRQDGLAGVENLFTHLHPVRAQQLCFAGDAFAAGYLLGLHEGWSIADRLQLAVCSAAQCMTHPTPSLGLQPVNDCLALGNQFPFRLLGCG